MEALSLILGIAFIALNIVGVIWLGIKLGHPIILSVAYIIILIILGIINGNVCFGVSIAVAGITLIVLIILLIRLIIDVISDKMSAKHLKQLQEDLIKAVNNNDTQEVQRLNNLIPFIDDANCADLLKIAVEKQNKEIISVLVEHVENFNTVYDGKTILDLANDNEIIGILRNHGAKTKVELDEKAREDAEQRRQQQILDDDLLVAVLKRDVKKAEELLSEGADVNYGYNNISSSVKLELPSCFNLSPDSIPLILFATINEDKEMIALLRKNGADVYKEVHTFPDGCVTAITYARYTMKNESLATFLEHSYILK